MNYMHLLNLENLENKVSNKNNNLLNCDFEKQINFMFEIDKKKKIIDSTSMINVYLHDTPTWQNSPYYKT